jgi:Uma2 family endonuclease
MSSQTVEKTPNVIPALATGEQLVTGEQLYTMSGIGPAELVSGEIIYHMPTGHEHGFIEAIIAGLFLDFNRQHKFGRVLTGEVGIYTTRNPDTVRAADIAFISYERLGQAKGKGYLTVAPEVVVEVMSPDDKWSEVQEKLEEYFEAGVLTILVVNPRRKEIHVYRSLDDWNRLTTADELMLESVLPGFRAPVAEIFAD